MVCKSGLTCDEGRGVELVLLLDRAPRHPMWHHLCTVVSDEAERSRVVIVYVACVVGPLVDHR